MKKNKFLIFYTILASAVIAFAIGFLAFNLISEYNHGYERTKRRFEHLTNSIKKVNEGDYDTRRAHDIELEKAIGALSDFSFLEITEDGKTTYIYPDENAKSTSDSKLIKHYYNYFDLPQTSIYITADLYLLRPVSIYYYSKISFLIILITTIITLILVVYFNIQDSKNTSNVVEIDNTEEISEDSDIEDVSDEFADESPDSIFEAAEDYTSVSTNTEEDSSSIFDEALKSIEASEKEESPSNETVTVNNEESISAEDSEVANNEEIELPYKEFEPAKLQTLPEEASDPSGLFSPVTGLGWENYLMTRLDNELNRAIGSEFDLALFIFKIPGLVRENEKVKAVCDYLVSMFQFKDLLFEYKNDSIVAIKVNMPLENALSWADKLYVDIKNIIGASNNCYIGITTRTIRMVSSERLLKEADEALIHAQEDPENPIIAFRANAEKYRQFLENTN